MKLMLSIILLIVWQISLANSSAFLPETKTPQKVIHGKVFQFPHDHNLHPQFQTEWWYVTTTLQGTDGQDYGAQFTLFANTVEIDGNHQRLYFAHAAVSSSNQFYHGERFARADMQHAGVTANPWQAFIDHWSFTGTGRNPLPGVLTIQQPDFGYQLKLSNADYFLQGDKGYSAKSADGQHASYYYSAPFIKATGAIRFKDKTIKVSGDAWLDREWSSGMFSAKSLQQNTNSKQITDNIGWDWLALRLSKDKRLMIYKVNYSSSGSNSHYITGVLMNKDNSQTQLTAEQIDWQPTKYKTFAGKRYPIAWQLNIPNQNIKLTINPLNDNQFLNGTIPYWEGAVKFNGTHHGKGYLELFY